jgi:hypothetical protein
MSQRLEDALEQLIDAHGLYNVTEALQQVCFGKSEHLAANWQDYPASKRWNRAGRAFDHTAARLHKIQLD